MPHKTLQSVERDYVEVILSSKKVVRHFGLVFNLPKAVIIVVCLVILTALP